ncbi:hypothetical protein Nepgr_014608 [Nepenthes gracilis]|uniref:ADF-H domain-containing protein n=1 Tax=Nepenthes gracilis TaxID=150966 RepID=A0AAD3SLI4_NEPGR|nr:hypothetical protein Nepgr_014608 [Nepenthes gracilis]
MLENAASKFRCSFNFADIFILVGNGRERQPLFFCVTATHHLPLSLYPPPKILSLPFSLRSSLGRFRSFNPAAMANAASGIALHDECKLKFLELKAKRTYRFIVFKIEEKQKQVVVEKLGEPTQSYEDFAASLPADECRYAVYDFDFVTEENCQKSRIFFIAWSPDTSRVRSKMIYASSKDRFKRELDGIQVELQATDPSEMGLDVLNSRAR